MRLNVLQSDVEMQNVGETTAFTISNDAKMFRILSDSLYQNKIGSMVREVCCNAFDSHVAAGWADKPFTVHLPDVFEPWFSVRDYGIGLDDAEVRRILAQYGKSTKEASNEMVGAFGLGAKTPFAYTDAFTLIAIKDGVKRTYSAFVAENGMPAITILGEEETEECNGVEVIVPVSLQSDFNRFRMEVGSQLTFFTTKPEIVNCQHTVSWMDWQSAGSYMNCENVYIGGANTSFRGVWIVQGIVGYRMDIEAVKAGLSPATAEFLGIIKDAALLKFDLGQIEVTPSREGVQYSKFTLRNIEALLESARAKLKEHVTETLAAFPDAYARALALASQDHLRRLVKATGLPQLDSPYYHHTHGNYYADLIKVASGPDAVEEDDEGNKVKADLYFMGVGKTTLRRRSKWEEKGPANNLKVEGSAYRYPKVLVKDDADKPLVRLRAWLADLGDYSGQVVILKTRSGAPVTPEQLAEVQERIGETFKGYTMLSDVDLPEVERGTRAGYKAPTAYTWNESDDWYAARHWERETDKITEFDNGAYYVTVDRLSVSMPPNARPVLMMSAAGLLDKPVMAIREKDVARIKDNPLWVPLKAKADEVISSIVNNPSLVNAYAMSQVTVDTDILGYGATAAITEALDKGIISQKSNVAKVFRVSRLVERVRRRGKARGYSEIARHAMAEARVDVDDRAREIREAIKSRIGSAKDEVYTSFPLLRYIDGWRVRDDEGKAALIHYIKAASGG